MNTFIDRVNAIVQQDQQPTMSAPTEPAYPDAGMGALENVANNVPRQTMIRNQPHMLAYINPQEEQMLRDMGGSGLPGPDGVPAYDHNWVHSGAQSVGSSISTGYNYVADKVSDAKEYVSTGLTNTFTGGGADDVGNFGLLGDALGTVGDTLGITNYGTNLGAGPVEEVTTTVLPEFKDTKGGIHETQAAANIMNTKISDEANRVTAVNSGIKYVLGTGPFKTFNINFLDDSGARYDTVEEAIAANATLASQVPVETAGALPTDDTTSVGVLDKIIPDTGENTALQNLGNLVSFLGDKTYVDGVEVEDERSFAEKIANLTLFDGAYYDPTGKLVEVSTGDDLTGGGTADGVFGENYVYGVADSAETGAEVDTTGMSDDEAITAQLSNDLLRDIPPSSLEYFASFFGNAVIPIFGNYLTGKMLDADIAGRRAIVDEQIAALQSGATPLYDEDGNYTGFDRSTMTGNVSTILDEYGAEGLLPGGLPKAVADDENKRFQTVFDVQSIAAEADPTGMSTEDGFITSGGTEYFINGDGSVQEVVDGVIEYDDAESGETVESVYGLEGGDSAQTFSDGDPVVKSIYNRFRISGSTAGLPFYMSKWMDGVDFDERLEKVMVDGKVMYKNAEGDVISAEDLKNALKYDDDGNIIETEE